MRFSNCLDEYEKLAPFYDPLIGPLMFPLRREVCRIARSRNFQNMLDLCCGTGEQCIMLDRFGFRVTGVDLSPAMLHVARKKSPGRIPYFLEDAANLHFEDDSFDCVMSSFALHEKDELTRDRILKEAKRVLTIGGKLLVVDFVSPRDLVSRIGQVFANGIEWLAGAEHHRHYKDYMKRGAVEGVLKRHNVQIHMINRHHLGSSAVVLGDCSLGRHL